MNIALIHFRVGETDGVSLEMDKWRKILEKMGHNTFYIAGSKGTCDAILIPELYYRDEYDALLTKECYVKLNKFNEEELNEAIINISKVIEDKLIKIITDNKIDLIVPNNILALGRSVQVGMAVNNAVKKTGVKVVGHHHDFYWEREFFSHPTNKFVEKKLEQCFPPKDLGEQMKHAVINTLAKDDLKAKKGLDSTVVPNVFDFEAPLWKKDDYNSGFKNDLEISDNQILFLQATRVTNRKAIELAIDLVATLNKPENRAKMMNKELYDGRKFNEETEYVLALVGLHEGIDGYEENLIAYAKEKNINLIVNQDLVAHSRSMSDDGEKIYSLWDAYVYCDIITYPSIYEGWGNQFLEGLFAKKPQVVFEYSVYESDIKEKEFDIISLGNTYRTKESGLVEVDTDILDNAANTTMEILTDKSMYYRIVEENFNIGAKYFSLQALEDILKEIF